MLHHDLMRFARVLIDDQAGWVRVETGDKVTYLSDAPWRSGSQAASQSVSLDAAQLLAPAVPGKIVAVGRNYAGHAQELGLERSEAPRIFFKPPSG
ncbi:MAG: fumarylacetoacetate hydrolase family protein, partial [Gammaproteobacteria bacterium]